MCRGVLHSAKVTVSHFQPQVCVCMFVCVWVGVAGLDSGYELPPLPASLRQLAASPLPLLATEYFCCAAPLMQGSSGNDNSIGERIANVATCAPFMLVGASVLRWGLPPLHTCTHTHTRAHTHNTNFYMRVPCWTCLLDVCVLMLYTHIHTHTHTHTIHRHCASPAARQFGRSFLAVGAVAAAYHSSWGRLRRVLRCADYWTIAHASGRLKQALAQGVGAAGGPPSGSAAGAAAAGVGSQQARHHHRAGSGSVAALLHAVTPFKPSLVTALNIAAVEVRPSLPASTIDQI